MAASTNYFCFVSLLALLFSFQIIARDSQFFSKVIPVNPNKGKETELPIKEETLTEQDQQPVFIPETQNGYGLYGHETGEFPPTTTTPTTINEAPYVTPLSHTPYKTEYEEKTNNYYNYNYHNNKGVYDGNKNDMKARQTERGYRVTNNNYYNYKDAYGNNQNEMTDTKFTENGYNTMSEESNNNYYNYKDAYGNNQNEMTNTRITGRGGYNSVSKENNNNKYYHNNNDANKYNGERQGMSDTRFMEGGKYFYNVNDEKYNPTKYGSVRGVDSSNWYSNNNNRGYHGNSENTYQNNNSMEGYQNEDEFEP